MATMKLFGRRSELRSDGCKGRFQVHAKIVHGCNDCHRNAGGDEAIFNSGRTGLVRREALDKDDHLRLLIFLRHTVLRWALVRPAELDLILWYLETIAAV